MDLVEFAKQVKQMRDLQGDYYFQNRSSKNLTNAERQEGYVDALTEGVLNPSAPITQLNMFKVEELSVRFLEIDDTEVTLHNELVQVYENGDLAGVYGMICGGSMDAQLFMPIVVIHQGPNRNKRYILTNKEVERFIQRLLQ